MTDRTHPGTGCVYRDMGGPCPAKTAAEEALIVAALEKKKAETAYVDAIECEALNRADLQRKTFVEMHATRGAYEAALDAVEQERGA